MSHITARYGMQSYPSGYSLNDVYYKRSRNHDQIDLDLNAAFGRTESLTALLDAAKRRIDLLERGAERRRWRYWTFWIVLFATLAVAGAILTVAAVTLAIVCDDPHGTFFFQIAGALGAAAAFTAAVEWAFWERK
jgi:hypothetical protein